MRSPGVTEDELFEVLSNRRRRYAVHALKRGGSPTELGDLAEQVAAWEYDCDVEGVTSSERKRVYTALQQSHLPKMDEVGVVDYDKQRGTVEGTAALADAELYMEVVRGSDIRWSEYYLALSSVGAALLAAAWMGAWPFTLLPDPAWGVCLVVAFAISSVAHWYTTSALGTDDAPPELRR